MASPQLTAFIQTMRDRPSTAGMTIQEQRAGFEMLAAAAPPSDDIQRETVDAGGVPAEFATAGGDDPTVFYLHGGGYCIGSIATHRDVVARFVRSTGGRALSIDYRLAPEHPFPAALDDATAAYRWLLSTGVDPARVVIAGDSAGGGLTVATLVALRDAGDPLPALGVCISPFVDMGLSGESMTTRADADPLIGQENLGPWVEAYLGGADPTTPLASPIYAGLAGLPPLLIMMGTAEVLYDDATRLAERARAAGVDVTLEPWEEMVHAWPLFSFAIPEGQQAIDRIAAFIKERLG